MSGLRARPEVPAGVQRAVQAAADAVVAESRGSDPAPSSPWRFSGRWFSAHPIRSRSRPG